MVGCFRSYCFAGASLFSSAGLTGFFLVFFFGLSASFFALSSGAAFSTAAPPSAFCVCTASFLGVPPAPFEPPQPVPPAGPGAVTVTPATSDAMPSPANSCFNLSLSILLPLPRLLSITICNGVCIEYINMFPDGNPFIAGCGGPAKLFPGCV